LMGLRLLREVAFNLFLSERGGFCHEWIVAGWLGCASWRFTILQGVDLSLSAANLDRLLTQLKLPPMHSVTKVDRPVPQCRESLLSRMAGFKVQVLDRDWLAQQGWWCRLGRKLFGTCTPDSAAFLRGTLSTPSSSPIQPNHPRPGCMMLLKRGGETWDKIRFSAAKVLNRGFAHQQRSSGVCRRRGWRGVSRARLQKKVIRIPFRTDFRFLF
jgi:hypothetical protein